MSETSGQGFSSSFRVGRGVQEVPCGANPPLHHPLCLSLLPPVQRRSRNRRKRWSHLSGMLLVAVHVHMLSCFVCYAVCTVSSCYHATQFAPLFISSYFHASHALPSFTISCFHALHAMPLFASSGFHALPAMLLFASLMVSCLALLHCCLCRLLSRSTLMLHMTCHCPNAAGDCCTLRGVLPRI